MRVLSLFDGISCGRVALDRVGIKPTWYYASEIDKNAIKVSRNNYPDIIQAGDVVHVRKLAETGYFSNTDLLIGGSPCQGFSNAGEGLGFDDPRSALFFEYVRVLRAVKPKWFLLENVKMKREWIDRITSYIGVSPILINSSYFSAQNRERLYWTNIPVLPFVDQGITLNDILFPGWESDREKSYCVTANYKKGANFKGYFYTGNRQIVFRSGKIPEKPSKENANNFQRTIRDDWRMLYPVEVERLQNLPDNYTGSLRAGHRYHTLGNGWTVDVIAHIFKGMM